MQLTPGDQPDVRRPKPSRPSPDPTGGWLHSIGSITAIIAAELVLNCLALEGSSRPSILRSVRVKQFS